MRTGKIGRFLFKIGYYKNRVEGPARIGVTRNIFGIGKVVGVWGGGISLEAEKRQLEFLRNPTGSSSAKERILQGIVNGKVSFNYIKLDEVKAALEELKKDTSLKNLAEKAIDKLFQKNATSKTDVTKVTDLKPEDHQNISSEISPLEKNTPEITEADPNKCIINCELISGEREKEVEFPHSQTAGLTFKGNREQNDDALLISVVGQGQKILLAVADGMGGHGGGNIASRIAIEKFEQAFDPGGDISEVFKNAYQQAHDAIIEAKNEGRDLANYPFAGTTLVSAFINRENNQNLLKVANVGDSRAYLIREGKLQQITPDDSYFHVFYPIEKRNLSFPLTPEYSEDYYTRSNNATGDSRKLRKVLGREPQEGEKPFPPFEVEIPLQEGDIVLLMSDGVHDYLPLDTFKKLIKNFPNMSPLEIARTIKNAISDPGDNITVAVYKHGEAKAQPKEESVPKVDEEKPTKVYTPDDQPTVVWTRAKEEATKVFNLTPEQVAIIDKNAELQSTISRAAEIIASKNREINQLKKTVEDLKTSVQNLEKEKSELKKKLDNPLQSANEYITQKVDELLKQYHALKEKLNHLVSQRKDCEAGIVDQEMLLATLRKIVNDQKAPYLAKINKIEEEYQNALNTPEIKGLAARIKKLEESGESEKLTLAKQAFATAISPLKRNRDAEIEEVNRRMKEELDLEKRENFMKNYEKAIEDLKLTYLDITQNEFEVKQEIDNIRNQIETLVGEVKKLINFLNSQISLLEEKSEISKKG